MLESEREECTYEGACERLEKGQRWTECVSEWKGESLTALNVHRLLRSRSRNLVG